MRTRLTRLESKSVMTRDPITVMPSETLEHAASLMRRHNVRALPVIHGGKVVGIVTAKDLMMPEPCSAPRLGSAHPPLKRALRLPFRRDGRLSCLDWLTNGCLLERGAKRAERMIADTRRSSVPLPVPFQLSLDIPASFGGSLTSLCEQLPE